MTLRMLSLLRQPPPQPRLVRGIRQLNQERYHRYQSRLGPLRVTDMPMNSQRRPLSPKFVARHLRNPGLSPRPRVQRVQCLPLLAPPKALVWPTPSQRRGPRPFPCHHKWGSRHQPCLLRNRGRRQITPLATQLGATTRLDYSPLSSSTASSTLPGISKTPMPQHSVATREQRRMLFSTPTQAVPVLAERRREHGTQPRNGLRQQETNSPPPKTKSGVGSTREARWRKGEFE